MKSEKLKCQELAREELIKTNGGFLQDIINICVAAYIYYEANKYSVLNYKD